MTCIVDPQKYPTKKSLRQAIGARESVTIKDPSLFNPREFLHTEIREGELIVVTNHPKRSWFAQIKKLPDGRFEVK